MIRLLLLPLQFLALVLLGVLLPFVWVVGVLGGVITSLRQRPRPRPRPAPQPRAKAPAVVLPFVLSDTIADEVLRAHEQALRDGRQPWH